MTQGSVHRATLSLGDPWNGIARLRRVDLFDAPAVTAKHHHAMIGEPVPGSFHSWAMGEMDSGKWIEPEVLRSRSWI